MHTAQLRSASTFPFVLRRVGAVLAGLVGVVVVTTITDVILHATGVFPPMDAPPMSGGLFLLALGYRVVYGIAGGWLTAKLAPTRPVQHALVLGAIGLLFSVIGAIAMWDAGPGWYSIGVAAITLPTAYLGARFAARS